MKLYVCWGTFQTFGPGHPCRNALDALRDSGHDPEIVRSYGWGLLPAAINRSTGRRLAREATGNSWLPLLITDQGETIAGTQAIKTWAANNPAFDRTTNINAQRPRRDADIAAPESSPGDRD